MKLRRAMLQPRRKLFPYDQRALTSRLSKGLHVVFTSQKSDGNLPQRITEWQVRQLHRVDSTFGNNPEHGFRRAFVQTLPYFLSPLAKSIVTHIDGVIRYTIPVSCLVGISC